MRRIQLSIKATLFDTYGVTVRMIIAYIKQILVQQ